MKNYIAVITQNGGCDYTIGCGMTTVEFEAKSMVEALLTLRKSFSDFNPDGKEVRFHLDDINTVVLYEIAEAHKVELDEWKRKAQLVKDAAIDAANTAKERAEFERLRKKFQQ